MNYEQKYKDTLERAKKWHNAPNADKIPTLSTRIIEEIFPELKESKDEKIRNQIINFIEEYGNPIHCEWQKDWIAWLEKQGEHVEINPTEFDTRLQALIGKFETLPKEELVGSLSFWLNVVQNDGTYKREEKQGEQKHAEWSEEDERMYNRIYDIVHSAAFSNYETDENGKECGEYAKIIGWLKSIKDKVQPKQEWGEEDEEMLRKCINATFGHGYLKECNWLKSLRPQNHWKPTKEQMNTMKYLAKYYAKGCDEPTRSIIEGLYEQLKQL